MLIKINDEMDRPYAEDIARLVSGQVVLANEVLPPEKHYLELKKGVLSVAGSEDETIQLQVNFSLPSLHKKLFQNSPKKHPLKKALGRPLSGKKILDGTAGFLEDSLLMTSWGAQVLAVERNPIVFALVQNAMERLNSDDEISSLLKKGVSYCLGDFYDQLTKHKEEVDVLYLDPMYPVKKKKALSAKKHRVMNELVGFDEDFEELFYKVLEIFKGRVVLKRPIKAPLIQKFHLNSFEGKSTRYDLYLNQSLSIGD